MDKILKYITDRQPLLNVSQLERQAGVPSRGIHKAIIGSRPLAKKYWMPIIRVLCGVFGAVVIEGWTVTVEEDGSVITRREKPGTEVESVETEPGVFDYRVTEQRSLYDQGDFVEHFLK